MKYNYKLSDNNTVIELTSIPFNEALPHIELDAHEFQSIKLGIDKIIDNKIKIDEIARARTLAELDKQKRIVEIQTRLNALSQDLVQDMAGEVVPNINERKAEFVQLHNELRERKGLEPRGSKNE